MTISNSSKDAVSIRFTSIEPGLPNENQVQKIANAHDCQSTIISQQTVNQPFCGIDYFVQEMSISPQFQPADHANQTCHNTKIENCICELESLSESQLSDGFFEIVG